MVVTEAQLKWYYTRGDTGASGNQDIAKSLGGSIGGEITSDTINNLFRNVTGEEARDGLARQYIAVMFENTNTADEFGSPKLYGVGTDADAKVKLQYAIDSNTPSASLTMNKVGAIGTKPTIGSGGIRVDFADIPASGSAAALPGNTGTSNADLGPEARVGVWFSRQILTGATAATPFQWTISVTGEANI